MAPRVLVILLVTSGLVLSGCLKPDGAGAKALAEPVPAKAMLEQARAVGEKELPGAQLKLVVGLEAAGAANDFPGEEAPRLKTDDGKLGDGLARLWYYHFSSERSARALSVLMEAPGKVAEIAHQAVQRDHLPLPLGDWQIDSDAAAQAARKDAAYGEAVGGRPVVAAIVLMQLPNEPLVWTAMAADRPGEEARAAVDAKTGRLLRPEEFLDKYIPRLEGGRVEGRATPLEVAKHAIKLETEFHPQLLIRFDPKYRELPAVKLNVTVSGMGRTHMFDWNLGDAGPGRQSSQSIGFPRRGEYEVTVRLKGSSDLLGLYTMSWCAEGEPVTPKPVGCP